MSQLKHNNKKENNNKLNGKKENENMKKSNGFHTKDSSMNSIKKPLSETRNRKIIINKNNPPNTILNYNYNYSKRKSIKRNISLNPDYINRTLSSQNKQKTSYSNIKNIDSSIEKKISNNKSLNSKTQRAKEYSIKVKKYNLGNSLISNRSYNSKNSKGKNYNKIRTCSSISSNFNNNNNIDNIYNWKMIPNQKKLNENNNQILINGASQNEKKYCNNQKSRNTKNNSIIFYKSNSIENKKMNGLTSTIMTINMKTMYKPINVENGNNKNNSQLNHSIILKKIKSFNNKNNIRKNIPSNYAQIYLRNKLKNTIENGMAKNKSIIYNKPNGLNNQKKK